MRSLRAVIVLVSGASAVVLIVGTRYFSDIIGPLVLALVLTVAVHPLRERLSRGRLPRWVGTVVALLCIFAMLAGASCRWSSGPSSSVPGAHWDTSSEAAPV